MSTAIEPRKGRRSQPVIDVESTRLTDDQSTDLADENAVILAVHAEIVVEDQSGLELMANHLGELKRRRALVIEKTDPQRQAAHALWKSLIAFQNELIEPIDDLADRWKAAGAAYQTEQRRIAAAAQARREQEERRAREEREREDRKRAQAQAMAEAEAAAERAEAERRHQLAVAAEEAARLVEAEELSARGQEDEANDLLDQPSTIPDMAPQEPPAWEPPEEMPPPALAAPIPKSEMAPQAVKGLSTTVTYTVVVEDPRAVVQAWLDGDPQVPVDAIEIKIGKLNAMARQMKDRTNIPGTRVVEGTQIGNRR